MGRASPKVSGALAAPRDSLHNCSRFGSRRAHAAPRAFGSPGQRIRRRGRGRYHCAPRFVAPVPALVVRRTGAGRKDAREGERRDASLPPTARPGEAAPAPSPRHSPPPKATPDASVIQPWRRKPDVSTFAAHPSGEGRGAAPHRCRREGRGLPQAPQRWRQTPLMSTHVGSLLPSGARDGVQWQGIPDVSAHARGLPPRSRGWLEPTWDDARTSDHPGGGSPT